MDPLVEKIARAYSVLTRTDAAARWRFAQQILTLRNALSDAKSKDRLDRQIGEECAKAIGRGKPYSAQWVRAYVNAAQQYQREPISPDDCEIFVALCSNNQSKPTAAVKTQTSAAQKTAGTKADALRMLAAAVKMALKRGATPEEIAQAVEALLPEAAQEEGSAA